MTHLTVLSPVAVTAPMAADRAATLFVGLLDWMQRRIAHRAERRQLRLRNEEAASLREYALRISSRDPRYAADLLAAADRHERPR